MICLTNTDQYCQLSAYNAYIICNKNRIENKTSSYLIEDFSFPSLFLFFASSYLLPPKSMVIAQKLHYCGTSKLLYSKLNANPMYTRKTMFSNLSVITSLLVVLYNEQNGTRCFRSWTSSSSYPNGSRFFQNLLQAVSFLSLLPPSTAESSQLFLSLSCTRSLLPANNPCLL